MITKASGLLGFLNTFGVQKGKHRKKKFQPPEAISLLNKQVAGFFKRPMVCTLRKQHRYEVDNTDTITSFFYKFHYFYSTVLT